MTPRYWAALGLMSLLLLAPVAVRAAAAAPECNRVVLQVNEDDSRKWHTILANINKVQDAMSTGVRFVACGNSMQAMHLTKDDMIDNIAYARAGYVELMRLQQQGWNNTGHSLGELEHKAAWRELLLADCYACATARQTQRPFARGEKP